MPRTPAEIQRARHGRANHESKNIQDLRDKPVGPKGVLKPTKAKKIHDAKSRRMYDALGSETLLAKKRIKYTPDTDSSYNINVNTNNRRSGKYGGKLGLNLKNKDLNSAPTTFKTRVKKKAK